MFNKVILSAAAASLFAACASAICPGYDFGIAEANPSLWQVFDDSCNVVQQVTSPNPCNGGVLDCTSAPNFTGLHLDGVKYDCSPDGNGDSCNGHAIQVCCLNKNTQDNQKPQDSQKPQDNQNPKDNKKASPRSF
ncbi:hypothetical protein SCLCIDRAFT_22393 [Scleroderma citrinum Foug A]|uniref:Hydrophobin n=1 Tax=Scleroderma citrinum Foug A TaxID=1036808 RepID=A0A0C3DZ48_9AGAM|nr:hypothetical protein SCLCIDRAFT_22393 [Scleroderma citrinum Foug A]